MPAWFRDEASQVSGIRRGTFQRLAIRCYDSRYSEAANILITRLKRPYHLVERDRVPLGVIQRPVPAQPCPDDLVNKVEVSFARVGAALAMKREDVFVQGRRLWMRLHEKGGKRHEMLCHQLLDEYLPEYIDRCGLESPKAPLCRAFSRNTKCFDQDPMTQPDAFTMIRLHTRAAGIAPQIGNHTFRATGITAYLKTGGTLENAAAIGNPSSTRTTHLYDRRRDEITLAEVEDVRL